MKKTVCKGKYKNGSACTNNAVEHGYCRRHQDQRSKKVGQLTKFLFKGIPAGAIAFVFYLLIINNNIKSCIKDRDRSHYDPITNTISGELKPKKRLKKNDFIQVKAGNTFAYSGAHLLQGPIVFQCPGNSLKLRLSDKGKILVSTNFYNTNKELVGVIEDNKWLVNRDNQFYTKFSKSSLFVVSKQNYLPLQVTLNELENYISIRGIFLCKNKFIFVDETAVTLVDFNHPEIAARIKEFAPVPYGLIE